MFTQFLIATDFQKIAPPAFAPLAPSRHDEHHLLDAALAGNQRAQTTLIRRYRKLVLSIALDITGTREDAEEAMQDTFVKAFRYLSDFRRESSFKTWLCRIARTTALNQLRLRGLPSVSINTPESPALYLPVNGESALENLLRDERAALVKKAMRQLSKEDETALQLFYFHEKNLAEISVTTGWTVGNVKSRLNRARHRLRKVLEAGQKG